MFVWFKRSDRGGLIARVNGKVALIHSGYLHEPGLAEIEVVDEAPRYLLVKVLGEAAMLEMLVANEDRSVRLKTAVRLFGDYHVRKEERKGDEEIVTFYWRGIRQSAFDSRLLAEIRKHQAPPLRRYWDK